MKLFWVTLLAVAVPAQRYEQQCYKVFEDPFKNGGWLNSSELVRGQKDDCLWIIRLMGSVAVKFTLWDLNITQTPNCSTDYLEVRDDQSGKVLMHECGRELPKHTTVISQGNSLRVHLKSNGTDHTNSFHASYTETCPAVNISRTSPASKVLDYNCTWTVYANNSRHHIQSFVYLQETMRPERSYVDVWDGSDTTGRHLGRLRSNEWLPSGIVGQAAAMHFRFVTFESYVGLTADYSNSSNSCGQRLAVDWTQGSQIDSSQYDSAADCEWNIFHLEHADGTAASFVQFTLLELNISNCSTDYLEVRDDLDNKVLMHLCGTALPENRTVASQGSSLTVRLKSSGTDHNNSFRASYAKVCGAIITVSKNGYLRLQPPCSWSLVAQNPRQRIRLSTFGYHGGFLDVWEGEDTTGEHRLNYTGNFSKGSITSRGPALHIRSLGPPPTWFDVNFSLHNHSYTDEFSTISSSQLDSANCRTDDCIWLIESLGENPVEFTLIEVDIESGSTDCLEVIDGYALDGEKLMHVCRSLAPQERTVTSRGSSLTVRLKSNHSRYSISFRARFQEVCVKDIIVSRSDDVLIITNCTWTLTPESANHRIIVDNFVFIDSHSYDTWQRILGREPGATCQTARMSLSSEATNTECVDEPYVEVWERLNSTRQHKGRFCEGHLPRNPIYGGPGSTMLVTFVHPPRSIHSLFCFNYNWLYSPPSPKQDDFWIAPGILLAVIAGAVLVYLRVSIRREQRKSRSFFEDGNIDDLIPHESVIEQAKYLPYDKIFEIGEDQLHLGQVLGMGAFGVVRRAEAYNILPDQPVTTVAVKMVHPNRKKRAALEALISELKIMVHLGRHLNVVNLLGANTADLKNILLVVEYCKYGNLLSYLLQRRGDFVDELNVNASMVEPVQDVPHGGAQPGCCATDLLRYGFQVALGMGFLASRNVLHGDLAARNVLLSDDNIVKICDFGLSKIVHKHKMQSKEPVLLPIKWMAMETLEKGEFTKESDVWSYGIFLWELFSIGESPYADVQGHELLQKLKTGYRLPKPRHATDEIYNVMRDCWQEEPLIRPNFPQLVQNLGSMLSAADRQMYTEKNKENEEANRERQNKSDYYDYLELFISPYYNILPSRPTQGDASLTEETCLSDEPHPPTKRSQDECLEASPALQQETFL